MTKSKVKVTARKPAKTAKAKVLKLKTAAKKPMKKEKVVAKKPTKSHSKPAAKPHGGNIIWKLLEEKKRQRQERESGDKQHHWNDHSRVHDQHGFGKFSGPRRKVG